MPILPIFATISCNNKKTNDSTEQFDLTKLETGFYNIPADYFSNNGIQLAGGFYFVLNDPNETTKMESDLGAYYKALLTKNGESPFRPSDEEFNIADNYKISKPNQVAILDRTTIDFERVNSTNFKETDSDKLVEISVTPTKPKNDGTIQKTTYELRTVELKNTITLKFTAKADLYSVSTEDKLNATLKLVEDSEKINLSVTKTFNDDAELNKRDKVTILVKKPQAQ